MGEEKDGSEDEEDEDASQKAPPARKRHIIESDEEEDEEAEEPTTEKGSASEVVAPAEKSANSTTPGTAAAAVTPNQLPGLPSQIAALPTSVLQPQPGPPSSAPPTPQVPAQVAQMRGCTPSTEGTSPTKSKRNRKPKTPNTGTPLPQYIPNSEDVPTSIDAINKNIEDMDEQQMEKLMEEEDYANQQLQLVALQIEREKKRKEMEAKKLDEGVPSVVSPQQEAKVPKKRGRKPKNSQNPSDVNSDVVSAPYASSPLMMMTKDGVPNNAELSEPPGSITLFSDVTAPMVNNSEAAVKKRRGRGKLT